MSKVCTRLTLKTNVRLLFRTRDHSARHVSCNFHRLYNRDISNSTSFLVYVCGQASCTDKTIRTQEITCGLGRNPRPGRAFFTKRERNSMKLPMKSTDSFAKTPRWFFPIPIRNHQRTSLISSRTIRIIELKTHCEFRSRGFASRHPLEARRRSPTGGLKRTRDFAREWNQPSSRGMRSRYWYPASSNGLAVP